MQKYRHTDAEIQEYDFLSARRAWLSPGSATADVHSLQPEDGCGAADEAETLEVGGSLSGSLGYFCQFSFDHKLRGLSAIIQVGAVGVKSSGRPSQEGVLVQIFILLLSHSQYLKKKSMEERIRIFR